MSKVARVRARWHGQDELPPSVWRLQLKVVCRWILIGYAALFYIALAVGILL